MERIGTGLRWVVAGLVLCCGGAACGAQMMSPQQMPPIPDASGRNARAERDPNAERMQEEAAKGRNSERQKRLVADTEKLLSLATELKQEVGKTDKNTLSINVIKKAEEIEKLAHSVKERMKGM